MPLWLTGPILKFCKIIYWEITEYIYYELGFWQCFRWYIWTWIWFWLLMFAILLARKLFSLKPNMFWWVFYFGKIVQDMEVDFHMTIRENAIFGCVEVAHASPRYSHWWVKPHDYVSISFAFNIFGFLALEAAHLLKKVQTVMHSNVMSPMFMNVVFQRLSFTIQKSLASQLIVRLFFIHV
jgi:hypothetical protein